MLDKINQEARIVQTVFIRELPQCILALILFYFPVLADDTTSTATVSDTGLYQGSEDTAITDKNTLIAEDMAQKEARLTVPHQTGQFADTSLPTPIQTIAPTSEQIPQATQTTYLPINSTQPEKILKYRQAPLSYSTPVARLEATKAKELDVLNLGGSGNLLFYSGNDYTDTQYAKLYANSLTLNMTYLVSPYIQFYGETVLRVYPYINKLSVTPVFINQGNVSGLDLYEGYFTLGDLERSPYYAYFGQINLPYGSNYNPSFGGNYSKTLQNTTQRALGLGYKKELTNNYINAEYFLFNGDTVPSSAPNAPTYGMNLISGAQITDSTSIEITGGYISNLAESEVFQNTLYQISKIANGSNNLFLFNKFFTNLNALDPTNNTTLASAIQIMATANQNYYTNFIGLGSGYSMEAIQHRAPAVSLALELNTYGNTTLSASYASTIYPMHYEDFSFRSNGISFAQIAPTSHDGAHPSAYNIYLSKYLNNDLNVYAGWEASHEALALQLPSSALVLGTNYLANAFAEVTLEYIHSKNYNSNCDARGPYRPSLVAAVTTDPPNYSMIYNAQESLLGQSSDTIIAALTVRF